jgi:uncharacterized protein (DUF488 family)
VKLYTIGHGNLEIEPFLEILRDNKVKWLADVRSAPYSRMFPWFNKSELAEALEEAGVRYVFLGGKLGGKPRDGEADGEWTQGRLNPALVSTLSHTRRWAEGIEHLAALIKATDEDGETGCLMCSEKNVNNCHRSLLSFNVQEVIPELSIVHLGHDSVVTEARFQRALLGVNDDRSDYH